SGFTSLREVARIHYGGLGLLAGSRFDCAGLVGGLSVPFFAAHGDRDTIVPYALGERLYALAREPKRFLRVPGAGHNDILGHPSVLDEIARFVAAHVTG
ncbi:MAG TPA: alpha/beta hydrolase, partial [Candidatus Binatia bacterium]|nr:alpha/beta hydrolase [Candidatus Binatia bacterium]